ncbi:hypothetical protein [Komagataeibacter xylinus]|uniref:hypothetical protein n=1 Tax=Komagataeibacter xylinus TaxID=28448 RepID=UPI00280A8169|nr:hypothetical protein [Komagataeibacter xylinus]
MKIDFYQNIKKREKPPLSAKKECSRKFYYFLLMIYFKLYLSLTPALKRHLHELKKASFPSILPAPSCQARNMNGLHGRTSSCCMLQSSTAPTGTDGEIILLFRKAPLPDAF